MAAKMKVTASDTAPKWLDARSSIKETDILFGRGNGPNIRKGNILYRRAIKERKAEYIGARSREVKSQIAEEVISSLRAKTGARFLRKATARDATRLGIPKHQIGSAWVIVNEFTILEKVKQALRQKTEWKEWLLRDEDNKDDHHLSTGTTTTPTKTLFGTSSKVNVVSPETTPAPLVSKRDDFMFGGMPPFPDLHLVPTDLSLPEEQEEHLLIAPLDWNEFKAAHNNFTPEDELFCS